MKKLLTIFAILFCIGWAQAQQLPMYTQYLTNKYVINPAFGGSTQYFEARSSNRSQWTGIQDAPRTFTVSVQGPLKNKKMGVGGYLYTDVVGPTRRTGLQGSYAYHVQLNDKMKLGLGVSLGVLQFTIDGGAISLKEQNDVAISSGIQEVFTYDANFGAYLYSDKYWVSLALPQLSQNKIQFFNNVPTTNSKLASHIFLSGGYTFTINDNFKVEPSAFIKYVSPTPIQVDIGARAFYKNKVWLGFTYRTSDAVAFTAGYIFQENLSISYSYDATTSNLNKYSSGTHEIMLGIRFKNRIVKIAPSQAEE